MGLLQTFALVGLALPSAIMAANSEIYMDGSFNLHYPDGKQVNIKFQEISIQFWNFHNLF